MSAHSDLSGNGVVMAQTLERDIERTRERVSRELDELGNRLRPSRLTQKVQRALSDNPWPAVAAGVGMLWLLARRRNKAHARRRTPSSIARRAARAAHVR